MLFNIQCTYMFQDMLQDKVIKLTASAEDVRNQVVDYPCITADLSL